METKTVPSNSCNGVVPAEASTLGHHLARRLVQIGVSDVFSVPVDYNMALLDFLVAEPGLNLIGCCSELNAGYDADGYARARGVRGHVHSRRVEYSERDRGRVQRVSPGDMHRGRSELERLRIESDCASHDRVAGFQAGAALLPNSYLLSGIA
ncbi:hypothetical protein SASPL_104038 [Salvia splendens]|uniref:pyruvate decarboxylase n=1 Tax=Salvia splendens TaxID=180675 RepID=A0A8X9A841_SALSN|nr:hypothetical protein SASPL_104038 [Salvia splendens]